MDKLLARRLNSKSPSYEGQLYRRLAKLGQDYRTAGLSALDYFIPDFDAANDIVNCHSSQTKAEFEKDRTAPENFRHPMGATEITTLATFISQILFGGETARKVEPRNPEDEPKADVINELLRWNDGQQPTYTQGFHFVWDALTFNRGVQYDHWADILEVQLEAIETELPWEPQVDENGKKLKKPKDYQGEIVTRYRKVRKPIGGFVKVDNISPYDFICDPTLPASRFQDGRFAGHRVVLTWQELKRRSELPVDHYQYVLPAVVEKLKNSKGAKQPGIGRASSGSTLLSRTAYERQRRIQPTSAITGTDKINKEDGGVVECWCIQIRAVPKEFDIFEDEEQELIELLIAGDSELLSVNVMTNKHDQYPYALGEGRPNAHMQFGPSWTMIIKGPQDYVDYLKNRHKESIARTSGNIFVGNPAYIDFEAFLDPKKDGLFIPVTSEGEGKPLDQIIKQIPVSDTTARFHEEMMLWQQVAEQASGAHANTQGAKGEGDPTATEYVGTAQMAEGRISTVARLLSSGALVQQTYRIVSNLQQFMPDNMVIRVTGAHDNFDPDKPPEKFLTVIRDRQLQEETSDMAPEQWAQWQQFLASNPELPDIQGTFDVVVSDGSLPGTDAKKVAALSRAIEAFASNPAFAEVFNRTRPGAIDPIKTFQKVLKATGFPIEGLLITREQAQKNLQEMMLEQGQGLGAPPPMQPAPVGEPVPPMPTEAGNIPSAEQLPAIPTAEPPGPAPQTV